MVEQWCILFQGLLLLVDGYLRTQVLLELNKIVCPMVSKCNLYLLKFNTSCWLLV
jgi:hypothetical protein